MSLCPHSIGQFIMIIMAVIIYLLCLSCVLCLQYRGGGGEADHLSLGQTSNFSYFLQTIFHLKA